MDDPGLPVREHEHALAGLARLNRWSRGDVGLWRPLRQLALHSAPQPLRVLDIATGSGDLPIRLWKRAQSAKLPIHFSACDLSATALALATKQAKNQQATIDFFQWDALQDSVPSGFDVIMVSLFLHHLSDGQIVRLLTKLAGATQQMLLVNDLSRSWWNYSMVTIASRLLSRSRVVHFDGPASVKAALTKAEILDLAQQAGLNHVVVRSQFPARWLLRWNK